MGYYGIFGIQRGGRDGIQRVVSSTVILMASLSFCSAGVNLFKALHVVYSLWSLMITVVNFPVALCKSFAGILLLGKWNIKIYPEL